MHHSPLTPARQHLTHSHYEQQRICRPVAIVTGSSSGIGEATAHRLRARCHRRRQLGQLSRSWPKRLRRSPGESCYIQAGIADQAQGHALIDSTIERMANSISSSITPAGQRSCHTMTLKLLPMRLEKTFDVNVFGTWWLTKYAMPHLSNPRTAMSSTSPRLLVFVRLAICCLRNDEDRSQSHDAIACQGVGPVRVNALPQARCDPVD